MKRLLPLTIAILAVIHNFNAEAQKLIIGERAPELKIEEWLTDKPKKDNRARLIDFYYSEKQITQYLQKVEAIVKKYDSKLDVIVVTYKKPSPEIAAKLKLSYDNYFVGVDEGGKSFSNFTVQYIPFSVLIDSKGRVHWFGNPETLSDSTISTAL